MSFVKLPTKDDKEVAIQGLIEMGLSRTSAERLVEGTIKEETKKMKTKDKKNASEVFFSFDQKPSAKSFMRGDEFTQDGKKYKVTKKIKEDREGKGGIFAVIVNKKKNILRVTTKENARKSLEEIAQELYGQSYDVLDDGERHRVQKKYYDQGKSNAYSFKETYKGFKIYVTQASGGKWEGHAEDNDGYAMDTDKAHSTSESVVKDLKDQIDHTKRNNYPHHDRTNWTGNRVKRGNERYGRK